MFGVSEFFVRIISEIPVMNIHTTICVPVVAVELSFVQLLGLKERAAAGMRDALHIEGPMAPPFIEIPDFLIFLGDSALYFLHKPPADTSHRLISNKTTNSHETTERGIRDFIPGPVGGDFLQFQGGPIVFIEIFLKQPNCGVIQWTNEECSLRV
jgi:hypothetical protein